MCGYVSIEAYRVSCWRIVRVSVVLEAYRVCVGVKGLCVRVSKVVCVC